MMRWLQQAMLAVSHVTTQHLCCEVTWRDCHPPRDAPVAASSERNRNCKSCDHKTSGSCGHMTRLLSTPRCAGRGIERAQSRSRVMWPHDAASSKRYCDCESCDLTTLKVVWSHDAVAINTSLRRSRHRVSAIAIASHVTSRPWRSCGHMTRLLNTAMRRSRQAMLAASHMTSRPECCEVTWRGCHQYCNAPVATLSKCYRNCESCDLTTLKVVRSHDAVAINPAMRWLLLAASHVTSQPKCCEVTCHRHRNAPVAMSNPAVYVDPLQS